MLVDLLAAEFPAPRSGQDLKMAMLNPERATSGAFASERDLLRSLIQTPHYSSFVVADLDFEPRLRAVFAQDVPEMTRMIGSIADHEQPFASKALDVAVATSDADSFAKWAKLDPEGLGHFLRFRPAGLQEAVAWKAVGIETLWPLAAKQRSRTQRSAIVDAILESGASIDPRLLLRSWSNGAELLLHALSKKGRPRRRDLEHWLAGIPQDEVVNFLRANPNADTSLVTASLAMLDGRHLAGMPAQAGREALDADESVRLAATLFSAALLVHNDLEWAEIAMTAFARLAGIVGKNKLREAAERLKNVEPSLPASDVQGRAARAANRAFKDGDWPIAAAFGLRSRSAFTLLIEADKNAGLARKMLVALTAEDAKATAWQRESITKSIRERSDRDSLLKTIEGLAKGLFRF
jgi:hypothetical protein